MLTFSFSFCVCGVVVYLQLRTLRPNFGTGNPSEMGITPQKKRRNYFLLAIAGLQIAAAWFLM